MVPRYPLHESKQYVSSAPSLPHTYKAREGHEGVGGEEGGARSPRGGGGEEGSGRVSGWSGGAREEVWN